MEHQPVRLVVYGDFNCPFSALASARISRLERRGAVEADWRAVEHAPDIPSEGIELDGEPASELERELEHVRGLLIAGEPDRLSLPTRQPNTRIATAAFASTPVADRPAMRDRLFTAHWSDGADLTDEATLSRLGAPTGDPATASRWHDEWTALGDPVVPMMVLPDGDVSRGLGALARLAELVDRTDDSGDGAVDTGHSSYAAHDDLGGEAPCFAHLLDDSPFDP